MSALPTAPVGPTAVDTSLGKRKASMMADTWYPGMGVPCFPFGPENEVQKRSKQFKTSLLFLELQAQVKQAIANKHKADAAERELSQQIAERNPISNLNTNFDIPVVEVAPATRKPVALDMDVISLKKNGAKGAEMPAPLTPTILEAARKELPAGAVFSIETCLKCWRENKMAWDEVLFTVKTFASSSPTLIKALETRTEESRGEQASAEQMRELSMLACA